MGLRVPSDNRVDVDMVPLIDIISLLLMFLIIVGDTAKSASSIPMILPRASEADTEKNLKVKSDGRIVVQLKKDPDGTKYSAVVNNKVYELSAGGRNKSLQDYLADQVEWAIGKGYATRDEQKRVSSAVKLRIPKETPMRDVERVLMTLSLVGLVNVQYAVAPTSKVR